MATIVNKTIWTNADWTPIVRKARMMAIPKEWDRATSPLDTEINRVEADKFKPVGYQNNGNKVYKNSKGQQFSLDSNGNAYLVNEKPGKQTNLNTIFKESTSLEDFATKIADQDQTFKDKAISAISNKISDITDIYKIKNWEQFMTPMQKYPSYQELSKPMFDNTNLNAPIQNTSVPIQNISEKEKNKKINNSWKEMKQLDNYLRKTHAWPVDYIGKSNAYGEWNITKWWFSKLMDEWN